MEDDEAPARGRAAAGPGDGGDPVERERAGRREGGASGAGDDEAGELGDGELGEGEPVRIELTDELDLHSFPPREVAGLVRDYLDHAAAERWEQVRIIHGKGIGQIAETVRRVLRGHPAVESFATPSDRSGWGATVVRLRPGAPRGA